MHYYKTEYQLLEKWY